MGEREPDLLRLQQNQVGSEDGCQPALPVAGSSLGPLINVAPLLKAPGMRRSLLMISLSITKVLLVLATFPVALLG